jgi:hypothetical protein
MTAVRARFAFMSAFIVTEIILTNVNELHIIINKLICVAWVGLLPVLILAPLSIACITLFDSKLFFSSGYHSSYTERLRPNRHAKGLASCQQMEVSCLEWPNGLHTVIAELSLHPSASHGSHGGVPILSRKSRRSNVQW